MKAMGLSRCQWKLLEELGDAYCANRIDGASCIYLDYGCLLYTARREAEEAAAKWRAERKTRRQKAKEAKQHDPCGS